MKEVIVHVNPLHTELVDSPIPVPEKDQVLIKVVVSGSNPKDWKHPQVFGSQNSGDDVAGVIASVGADVHNFRPGDRVAAFHKMDVGNGSFAEYCACYAYTTFLIPDSLSFEEASTIPLASLTAAYGLFDVLQLPTPWWPARDKEIPFLLWGASTSVGLFTVMLAKLAGIGPIIGVAGANKQLAADAGCDFVVDYRSESVIDDIRACLKPGQKLEYAYDCAISKNSWLKCVDAMDHGPESKICLIIPREFPDIDPVKVTPLIVKVANAHFEDPARQDFAFVFYQQFSKWLFEKKVSGLKYKVVEGGLAGVEKGLKELNENKVSGYKNVFRIADTPGL